MRFISQIRAFQSLFARAIKYCTANTHYYINNNNNKHEMAVICIVRFKPGLRYFAPNYCSSSSSCYNSKWISAFSVASFPVFGYCLTIFAESSSIFCFHVILVLLRLFELYDVALTIFYTISHSSIRSTCPAQSVALLRRSSSSLVASSS